jgi:hypothetical protein
MIEGFNFAASWFVVDNGFGKAAANVFFLLRGTLYVTQTLLLD